jgi:hypothetical protein
VIKANKSQETSIVTKQMEKDKPKKKAWVVSSGFAFLCRATA